MPTLLDALDEIVAADAARPLLTWYRAGARIELSGATVTNWVAKTAGLLQNELLIDPGSRVRIEPGEHWLSLIVPLAVWRTGAVVTDEGPADLLVSETPIDDASATERLLLPSDAFGLAVSQAPSAWQQFSELVHAQPDHYSAPKPTGEQLAQASSPPMTHDQLRERSHADAQAMALPPGGRLLVLTSAGPAHHLDHWCAALAMSGSLILTDELTPALVEAERADVTVS